MPARGSSQWYRFQVRARRLFNRIPLKENQRIYFLTLLIGATCGLAAVSFHQLIDFFTGHLIFRAAEFTGWRLIVAVLLVPTAGGLIAGLGLYFYAPEAQGSGIPQVKKAFYLDGGRIKAKVIWSKMFLSSFNIGTGASLGREGPTVQICAAIASLWGRVFVISRSRRQSLIPIGAAAGLAAAFNTPIAAVTFTMEEILADTSARPLGSIVIAAVIAAVTERAVLGEHPVFTIPQYRLHSVWELPLYALLGAAAAVLALAFNQGLLRLRSFSRTQSLVPPWATPAAGGFCVGLLGLSALLLTGSASIFGVGYGDLSKHLHVALPVTAAFVLCLWKLAATILSYSSGSSGGIFGPALYIGGMLGGIVGSFAAYLLKDLGVQPEAFALVGMGAVFAGIVRAPVTSIIMIFEMTNNYSIILPLMIANIISYGLARKLDPVPIYEALLIQDGVRMPHSEKEMLKKIRVSSAMTKEVITLDTGLTVLEAFHHVQSLARHHHAYPVVDQARSVTGIVTFNDLKRSMATGQKDLGLHEAARRKLITVHPQDTLETAMLHLGKSGISQLPVVSRRNPGRLVGIITMHDVARAIAGSGQ